eukprot:CAMPEP_0203760766 /NCGR_PEP_ID=MMETSP0098-20131031/13992_1 /ASSEMBLY_ACC=CAM_ASM_000208 /TAXON_ID=96639 /ORGANISM=" , Strain NY0313808BC1" /LENGTH=420 /DNA_ID=CAMNT_0050654469 /DNA_START=314 /DNA_END=1573 /DNA_ORIENTATION=-
MGCTQAKPAATAGPRAVVSSNEIPGGKAQPNALDRNVRQNSKLRKHDTDTVDPDVVMSPTQEEEQEDVQQDAVCIDDIIATMNVDRRRLSIMSKDKPNPVHGRPQRSHSHGGGSMHEDLADPGEDIGNGAYGENGEYSALSINYSCVTRPGNDPAKRQKENQDTYCVHNGLGDDEECFVVCVFDGHGPNGGRASHYVRDSLVETWRDLGLGKKTCSEEEIKTILHNGCVGINERLATSSIDVYVSGSTGILGVIKHGHLYVANVGDSRAVLGRAGPTGKLKAIDLSDDQKPDRPDEHARIIKNGGRVFEWGVSRVWRKDCDMPGLAMARSFGDLAAESVGVFAEPEISVTKLTKEDKFLVFATDGVWEFLQSKDIVKIVGKHMSKKPVHEACRDASVEIIKSSVAKWNAIEDVVDDSTCV